MESNYEKMKQQMKGEFLKYNQVEMINRFHLDADEQYLYFPFLGSDCRVDRKSGVVECFRGCRYREGDYNEAMTVYDLLCWSKPEAAPSGEFVSMQSLFSLKTSSAQHNMSAFFASEARLFDHREEDLAAALKAIGGNETEGGDIAFFIEVFKGLKVLFRYWNSDEEFEPQIQLLWDKNVLLFMHYETVWLATAALISRICESINQDGT